MKRLHVHVEGVVQGVGFRPFVYRQAKKYDLTGFVYNHSQGVEIEVQGHSNDLELFRDSFRDSIPPLARVDVVKSEYVPVVDGDRAFVIRDSVDDNCTNTLIPPDIATCEACSDELFDPNDRRYRYPFVNCMNCGPRYTIIKSVPYDRINTTMSVFPLCPNCKNEYNSPEFRRFHAEPNACDVCGPHLRLVDPLGNDLVCDDILSKSVELLRRGKILAVKSLGGFHLACDATNEKAVKLLRERKNRPSKPFAVMSFALDDVMLYSHLSEVEKQLILSPQRPIVLLRKKVGSDVLAESVAPLNNYVGVMIAYNPLQMLLLKNNFTALVMTSGNHSEEPIIIDNKVAMSRLSRIADAFLLNDRDINTRVDDSIVFVENSNSQIIRRARGYVPDPIKHHRRLSTILGVGGELKSTFTLSRDDKLFISQHIGDLKNVESYHAFTDTLEHMTHLLNLNYDTIAHDLHPDYLSTRYAMEKSAAGFATMSFQHHKSHIASCIGDNGLSEDDIVIGLALDGTGYGLDGSIWGCEGFVGSLKCLERRMTLRQFPLPGGNKAIEEPYRLAISCLYEYLGDVPNDLHLYERHAKMCDTIKIMVDRGINSPVCSSAGRLFDAVSSLVGLKDSISYESEAAVLLQMISEQSLSALSHIGSYQIDIRVDSDLLILDPSKMFDGIIADLRNNTPVSIIGVKFHKSLSSALLEVCLKLNYEFGIKNVILSGGVFQNRILLRYLTAILSDKGFNVYTHKKIPCNDGGISAGQVLLANYSDPDTLNK